MLKIIVLLTVILAGAILWLNQISMSDNNLESLTINNINLAVEIVDTPTAITRGLSGRTNLPANQGMLFVFNQAGSYSFWMKDMHFPIDIIWIGMDWHVVDITPEILPETFPQKLTSSDPAQYVLEVNAGFVEQNKIKIGDLVNGLVELK